MSYVQRWARPLTLLGVAASVCLTLLPVPASAHDAGTYFPGRHPRGTVETFYIGSGVASIDRVILAIRSGASDWNNWTNFRFAYGGRSYVYPSLGCYSNSQVFQYDLTDEPNALAATRVCRSTGTTLATFTMVFDNRSWHSDQTPVPPGHPDRWAVATHEFGHAAGFNGHWPDSSSRCVPQTFDRNLYLSMCGQIPDGFDAGRDLGDHDIHTFQGAYQ